MSESTRRHVRMIGSGMLSGGVLIVVAVAGSASGFAQQGNVLRTLGPSSIKSQ